MFAVTGASQAACRSRAETIARRIETALTSEQDLATVAAAPAAS
jgi:hypothetical protein